MASCLFSYSVNTDICIEFALKYHAMTTMVSSETQD